MWPLMFVIGIINCLVFLFGSDLSSCLFSFLPFSFHAMLMGAEFGLQFALDNTARPVQNRKKEMLKWLDARNSGAPGAQSCSTIVSYPASPLLLSYSAGFLFDCCHNDSNDKNGFNHTNQSQRRNPQRLYTIYRCSFHSPDSLMQNFEQPAQEPTAVANAICQAYCKKQKTSDESFGCWPLVQDHWWSAGGGQCLWTSCKLIARPTYHISIYWNQSKIINAWRL